MTIDVRVRDGKLRYNINKEAAKQSSKIDNFDKFEYLTDKELLPTDQIRVTEQGKSTYSLLGKTFENK